MLLSRYVKVFPCDGDTDHSLLFSTKKMSKIRLSHDTLERMQRGALSPAEENRLAALGFLAADAEEERREVCACFSRINEKNTELDLTVMLNRDCNFSCLYCYEGGPSGGRAMTSRTAEQVVAFARERFGPEKTTLQLMFHGGEPLLSLPVIHQIAGSLKAFAESRAAEFNFLLMTNGSLLNRSVAERLVPLGLQSAKITLDGPEPVHDRYRPFKSGAGSFGILIRNIKETCDLVSIHIGGNYDQESWPRFVSLLDRLQAEGLTPDRLGVVKFDPILKPVGQKHLLARYHGGCMGGHEPWILEASVVLRQAILDRGYRTLRVQPAMCAIENNDSLVVDVDGRLYKCPAFVGREAYAIGDVSSGVKDYRETYRLDLWKNDTCRACEYLPLCYGGCRYMSTLAGNGVIDAVQCRKSYLDAVLETLVKQDLTSAPVRHARSGRRIHGSPGRSRKSPCGPC